MEMVIVLLRQIAIMVILVTIGILLRRKNFLSIQGSKDLGNILLRVIIPCVILKSYLIDYSQKRLTELGISTLLALIGFVVAMLIAYLVYGKRKRIENFSAAFCNAGFIGIPLAQAITGEEGAFYVASTVALLNLFQWTYGVYIMTDKRDAISIRTIIKNPVLIAFVGGVLLFVLRVQVPSLLMDSFGLIANMNTPVAMILLGTYMAKLSIKDIINKKAVGCVLMRLIIIPALILLVFIIIPITNNNMILAVYLAAITPVGANICIFAQQYECDYEFSVVTVCLSTALSVITIPALVLLAQMVL